MTSRPHPHDLLRHLAAADPAAATGLVLATIWSAEGSTPLDEGAQALIGPDGLVAGTVGGGAAEAAVLETAPAVRSEGRPRRLLCDLQGPGGGDPDPICGGRLELLLQPLGPDALLAPRQAALALSQRRRGFLRTTLSGSGNVTTDWVDADDRANRLSEFDENALRDCLERGEVQRRVLPVDSPGSETSREVLLHPVVPKPTLFLIGGGHVGQALAAQAVLVGFAVTVLDERPDFLRREAFPDGTTFLAGPLRETIDAFPFAPDTYAAVMTRGHLLDAEAIAACLGRPAAYLGMIGSRRKVTLLRDRLLASGQATTEQWQRVHSPIGLDLGAVTAPEIAASIVAELIAIRRRGVSPRHWSAPAASSSHPG